MSTFDLRADAPGMLRTEAMNITLSFARTGPTTGRVSWNIPTPATRVVGAQAYAGMVVTLDTTAANINKIPTNGKAYTADPTATINLFAGDKIGTSLVVGAFYDTTTTFFDITGLLPNTPYYVSGFPTDAQYRYFVQGIHAYSQDVTNRGTDSTHGSQVVVLNPEQQKMGVQPTDSTGLLTSLSYGFKIRVGLIPTPQRPLTSVDCILAPPTYDITVDGANSQDYQQLVTEINKQLSLATNNTQGASPPRAGDYYWNPATNQLFQWDGYTHNLVPNVIIQANAPSIVTTGSHWYNPTADVLSVWSGSVWTPVTVVKFATDPTMPLADSTYWYNSTLQRGYTWNGAAWCEVLTYTQATDPSLVAPPPAGSYWFNTTTSVLYRWNETLGMWSTVSVIEYATNPNSLTPNDFWFNTTTNSLYQYAVPSAGWNLQANVSISETAPTQPANGKFWFNPTTQVLKQWYSSIWNVVPCITFAVDPTVRTTCGLWWDTSTHTPVLKVWDAINSTWVAAPHVYYQGIDPTIAITIADGTLWYNTTNNTLNVWENNCFVPVPFLNMTADPIGIVNGTAWLNTTTNVWYIRTGGAWAAITPTNTSEDPNSLTTQTFWFKNTPTVGLTKWNGAGWGTVMYSTQPLAPLAGSTWFNTTDSILMQWNGLGWIVGTPVATAELDCNGNILFTDTTVGGLSFITLTDVSLFRSLITKFIFHDETPGTDGASNEPSYSELGIGTDGSAEARLQLHTDIRYELGYPTIDVEVSPQQLDYAIDKALGEYRARASNAYRRGFFFMAITAENQNFILASKISGMNKIVDVLGCYRLTSSFLSSAHGAGVYGQIVLQHMYNMGTFDLLSYHIMAEYTKLMEILFAARLSFTWNEQTRTLHLQNRFPFNERQICIEATTERTEQDLLTDRYTKVWLRRYALAVTRIILAETRGKFSSLPGASGAITLNASELRQAAATEIEACLLEIDQFVADKPEEYGKYDFTFG
jgi:hypothetical protein